MSAILEGIYKFLIMPIQFGDLTFRFIYLFVLSVVLTLFKVFTGSNGGGNNS